MSYMTTELNQKLFESHPNDKYHYGINWHLNSFIFDAADIQKSYNPLEKIQSMTYRFSDIQDVTSNIYRLIDEYTKLMASTNLNLIILTTILYSVATMLLFLAYYMPCISSERRGLLRLEKIISLIPSIKGLRET